MSTPGTAYRYDPTAFREVFERRFTYLAGVERNATATPPGTPSTTPRRTAAGPTRELWEDAGRVAADLAAPGVGAGDVVVFQLHNGPEFALLWLAAQRLGADRLADQLPPRRRGDRPRARRQPPRGFVYDAGLAAGARDALALASHAPRLVVSAGAGAGSATPFETLLEDAGPPPPAPEGDRLRRDDPALHVGHHRAAQGRVAERRSSRCSPPTT